MGATASAQGRAWGPRKVCARVSIVEGVLKTPSRPVAHPTRAAGALRSAKRLLSHSVRCALGCRAAHALLLPLLPAYWTRALYVHPYDKA